MVNDSYPIDYADHLYVSIKPWFVDGTADNLDNLLNTTASLELAMFYLEIYEYEAPEIEVEPESSSQAVVLFWLLIGISSAYFFISFIFKRRKKINSFLAGMIMPSAEFRYREYQIDRRFK